MNHSTSTEIIDAALAAAQPKIAKVVKARTAEVKSRDESKQGYLYQFADLSDAFAACRGALGEVGVAVHQTADPTGKTCITTLRKEGQWLATLTPILSEGTGPRAWGSAFTYSRRYGLLAACGFAPENDDDDGGLAQRRAEVSARAQDRRRSDGQRSATPAAQRTTAPAQPPPPTSAAQVASASQANVERIIGAIKGARSVTEAAKAYDIARQSLGINDEAQAAYSAALLHGASLTGEAGLLQIEGLLNRANFRAEPLRVVETAIAKARAALSGGS